MARWNLCFVAACAFLLSACVSHVRLAPDAYGWQTAGSEASWRGDPVIVVAKLDTDNGALPARGLIVNTGTAPVRVTFEPDVVPAEHEDGQPDAAVGGVTFAVPESFDLTKGTFEFALRADERWSGLPPAGASVSWTIVVTTASGETRCPFRFRVESTARSLSPAVEYGIVTVLLSAALVAGWYFAFY